MWSAVCHLLLAWQKPLLYPWQHLLLGMPSSPLSSLGKVALNGTLNLARLSKECQFCLELFAIICFPDISDTQESACDAGSIPGLGRSPGEGNGNPLQYSCLENPMREEPSGLQSMGSQESDTTQQQQLVDRPDHQYVWCV